ncbi:MAG: hypothetical protein V1729_01225 [Candidatus Woesearchaeota archaeon]
MKQKLSRNYLLLGASLLVVGLLVELLSMKVQAYPMNVFYKTLIIMLMIAIGYGFAESMIAPVATKLLRLFEKRFVKSKGKIIGTILFYIVLYATLFVLYYLIFT